MEHSSHASKWQRHDVIDVSSPDRRPSVSGLVAGTVAVVLATAFFVAVVVPLLSWVFSIVLPVLLVVGGAGLVAGRWGRSTGTLGQVAGWGALALGGLLLLGKVLSGLWSLVTFLFVWIPLLALFTIAATLLWRAVTR